jgi:hypothetical protein
MDLNHCHIKDMQYSVPNYQIQLAQMVGSSVFHLSLFHNALKIFWEHMEDTNERSKNWRLIVSISKSDWSPCGWNPWPFRIQLYKKGPFVMFSMLDNQKQGFSFSESTWAIAAALLFQNGISSLNFVSVSFCCDSFAFFDWYRYINIAGEASYSIMAWFRSMRMELMKE